MAPGRLPARRRIAARRFSGLAAWCFALTAVSGLVNALVRLGSPVALLTSDYGRAVLVKMAVLVAIGVLAQRARRSALGSPAAGQDGPPGPTGGALARTTGLELVLMSTAIGPGVALNRTPPPVGEPYTTAAESLLGGPVPPPVSLSTLLWSWAPSGVGMVVVGLGAVAYVAGLVTLRRRGVAWPVGRTVSFGAGLVVVAYATMGGLGVYSHVMFSAHMGSHMLLSMIAPVLLVLGAPVTLALRALPGGDLPGAHGPRQWLARALASRPARVLTHPVVAAALFAGSLYVVYLTPLFDHLMRSHLGHAAMELHFLAVGLLFCEVIVGSAPMPHRLSHLARLGLLLVVVPFHAFFAITVMSASTVIAGDDYALLDRGYATDLLADQHLGGSLTWALGEVPMVMVLVVLVAQWYRSDQRDARRQDRHAERDGGAELASYNEMLARLSRSDDS